MTMAMIESIVGFIVLLMLLLILLLVILACKPWRFFPSSWHSRTIKVAEEEKLLMSDNAEIHNQNNDLPRDYDIEGALPADGHFRSPRAHGLVYKQRFPSASPHANPGDSFVLDVKIVSEPSEDILLGQTLKHPYVPNQNVEGQRHVRQSPGKDRLGEFVEKDIVHQRSCLTLEVISGPSSGLCFSVQSTDASRLPLTLGRVSPSDLLINDTEVSGKHALIQWNLNKIKWELVDMGSLNGTFLNSQSINNPDSGRRQWGDPIELGNGDIITLGTSSKVHVHVTSQSVCQIPFAVGIASDPMALRRGAKKLAMEDVCFYQWPLRGIDQFGLFCIWDGHGGVAAARSASEILPERVATILADTLERQRVLSQSDASDVLRDAFAQTEACMDHPYEGCTATVLLVWAAGDGRLFVQCANVGDSACVINVDGKQIKMTEDHRITSFSERVRIEKLGEPLKDGETRLCGLNLARMLGDKFLKQQDNRFSSEPYISQVVHINQANSTFALMASDGLWDVISVKKAIQLVLQARQKYCTDAERSAERIASFLLGEARTLRTKDNTSIIFLDFGTSPGNSCKEL